MLDGSLIMNHKSMKRIFKYLLLLVFILCPSGCEKDSLIISRGTISCIEGSYFNLSVKEAYSRRGGNITWMSSDTNIASEAPERGNSDVVSRWYAKKTGHCVITCDYSGKTAFCHVSVMPKVDTFRIEEKSIKIPVGESRRLNFHLAPSSNLICGAINWTSSSEDVAIVSDGLVKAVGKGHCLVSVRYLSMSESCEVKVAAPLEDISLEKQFIDLYEWEIGRIKINVHPDDATIYNPIQVESIKVYNGDGTFVDGSDSIVAYIEQDDENVLVVTPMSFNKNPAWYPLCAYVNLRTGNYTASLRVNIYRRVD